MAGVVAMPSVIEDFEATEPCKKMRKEDDPPPIRTITNYFLPLPKPVEKPFSPPRSNNIMDYFKKTPHAQEKTTHLQKCSDLQTTESSSSREDGSKLVRPQRQRRTKKTMQPNKPQEQEVLTDNCGLIDNPDDSLANEGGSCAFVGSDTAALISKIRSEICLDEELIKNKNPTQTCADDKKEKDAMQNCKNKNLTVQSEMDVNLGNGNAPASESRGKVKKSMGRKTRKAKISQQETCNTEDEQSVHDASLEVSVNETSVMNCRTVTVSFEEFLQSQNEGEAEIAAESTTDAKSCMNVSDLVPEVPQVSPRTLTVQAEVHPISPESAKGHKLRMASIFSRNKKKAAAECVSMSPAANPHITVDVLPELKRKSNVVLREEDLELDVVESSFTPKCTQEERKQFMSAFKQPSLDGSKGRTTKAQNKLKQAKDNDPETVEPEVKADESSPDMTRPEESTEQKQRNTAGKKKGKKSGNTKCMSEKEPATPKQENDLTSMEVENESGCTDDGSKQSDKKIRRSTRDSTRRQTASAIEINPRKTRSREKAESSGVPQVGITQVSTPKSKRPKKNVYKSEMLFPVNKRDSAIRMRITRVFPSSPTQDGEFEISSPLSVQESSSLKKRKQAKRLVQKAKALQQSKQSAVEDPPAAVRRSARSKGSGKIYYCDDENSVVFIKGDHSSPVPTALESDKTQKTIRSLNEVLGKNIPPNKNSKNTPASKMAPVFQDRKALKPSAVISILDDSSREGSENSQDDEQFRAKREFLKSGLPESFKKQIAKTAANKEAYALASASFQPVVHVQQRPMDCSVWTLPWPESPLLSFLKAYFHISTTPLMSLEGVIGHCTVPTQKICREKVSGWQEDFTEPVRQRLLEEISASNPSFPIQRFFTRFLKKRRDYMQPTSSEPEWVSKTHCADLIPSGGGKRKRVNEGEQIGKLPKKQKSAHKEEEPIVISDSPNSDSGKAPQATDSLAPSIGRRRRSQRHKQPEKEPSPTVPNTPKEMQCGSPILDSSPSEMLTKDGMREDVLWTEKYQPQHSNDVIGNTSPVRKLHSWLKEWKQRADREERRKQQEKKENEDSNDCWSEGDSNESFGEMEDMLCNTLLITGPTGVGKTAAVYACAQELGFKVFEVNCSSQRSGRQILSQLKEATQSHQVGIQGVNAHKPTYFNSYSSSSSATPGSSPRKISSPRRVVSSPRKPPQSPRGGAMKKGGLVPVSLANFFKMGVKSTGKDAGNQEKRRQTRCTKGKHCESQASANQESKPTAEEQVKRTATCLILFEEVNVIFDDDSGFLAAVKTFMATTKRPVILTSSDPSFSTVFDGQCDEIHFKTPSTADVVSYLQLLCLGENVRTDTQDLTRLLHWNKCDIRQSLLHLQFWSRGGGGRQLPRSIVPLGASDCDQKKKSAKLGDEHETLLPPCTPPCHIECTESFLGLLNIQQEKGVEDLLRSKCSAVESMRRWGLLSKCERRGVNLLYSNLEVLLPLPIRPLPNPTLRLPVLSNPEPQPGVSARCGSAVQQDEHSDMSPVKVSGRMRRKKRLNMEDKYMLQSDSESDNDFLSLRKPSPDPAEDQDANPAQDQAEQNPIATKVTSLRMRRVELSEAERKKSKPVSQCLRSLAEYLDHMSFLDSSLHFKTPQTEGACKPQENNWSGAEIKSGMTDDIRLECEGSTSVLDSEELRAMLGSLSFSKTEAEISEAWNEVQELEEPVREETVEELTLPVASHRQNFSLIPNTLCEFRVMDMRREVVNTVLTNLSLNRNRIAVTTDYLPSLRTICKSERLKEQGKVKRRFMHYCDSIHLDLPKSTLQCLALDFP